MEGVVSASIQRGLVLKQQGRFREAERYFRDALSQDPHNAFALNQLAGCQVQLPTQERHALGTIDRALACEPEEPSHHVLKAFILCVLSRPQAALDSARTAVELDPISSAAYTAQAQAHLQMERWADAEAAARQALEWDADNTTAANQLARALMLQNKRAEHDEQLAALLAKDPENPFTHSNAGWAALQRGDHRAANRHFLEALRLDPDYEYARNGLIHAFKARSPLYRGYLQYCFAMQRLSKTSRIAVILGLYVGVRFARHWLTGPYAPAAMALTILYFLFALWVWVAQGMGNFLLMLDPFARHALRANEKVEAVAVGGGLLLGIGLVVAGVVAGAAHLACAGALFIGSAFPFAVTFTNGSNPGAYLYGAIGALVVVCAVITLASPWLSQVASEPVLGAIFATGLIAAVASTWLGAFNVLRR